MIKVQQNQTESQLISLVDNIDFKEEINDEEFILLIKKQSGKNYSTMYLTDCQDNFWLKKIDINFLENLKDQLKLKTNTQTFIKCLIKSLKNNCKIDLKDDQPKLQVKLQIGEGLTMTSYISFTTNLHRQKDQKGHKIILKLFLRQLYESKQSKQKIVKKEIEQMKQKKIEEQKLQVIKKDNKFINEVFHLSEQKKDPNKALKNRDLLNPNRKKRKHAGVKLNNPN